MDAVKRVRPVSAVIAALAAVIAVLVATSSRTNDMAPPAKVSVNASFNRQAVEFGDRVDARIVVLGDRKALGSSRIRLEPGLSPLTQLSRSRVTRTSRGSTIVYTVDVPVACLDDHCVAARRRSRVVHPAGARVRLADGTTVAAPWPPLVAGASRSARISFLLSSNAGVSGPMPSALKLPSGKPTPRICRSPMRRLTRSLRCSA